MGLLICFERGCVNFIAQVIILIGIVYKVTPGLVNVVPAVAHHFCLNLPAAFTQPGCSLLADCPVNVRAPPMILK